ncbi:hypothetical protein HCBG_02284 [Histoplasma capsulatum G186AR]|uniref:Uncharacterized protein n=1 Tax=Ajellomyces capsulatus (strain G186AR / H82 / ATCC MYA-2454 / RMSCC 2432) TaxID=447093 RepID=C0NIM7_AJECG|nr:uncharacterized protein HCBG_02284 [Histoplasma capsulatum G186AR]EEH08747.1 hypothetical protein HCBG_02284 [Histoplasma capsulatum G186AR]
MSTAVMKGCSTGACLEKPPKKLSEGKWAFLRPKRRQPEVVDTRSEWESSGTTGGEWARGPSAQAPADHRGQPNPWQPGDQGLPLAGWRWLQWLQWLQAWLQAWGCRRGGGGCDVDGHDRTGDDSSALPVTR